jgi:uncharacterized protein (TIGR02466 family)
MQITPVFSVGIGRAKAIDLLPAARQLFADNRDSISLSDNGLRTTLRTYNSKQDCAELKNQDALSGIKQAIKKNAIAFYDGLGFDTDKLEFEVVNVWLNEMGAGSTHPTHCHYGFQLSGCFYVDVPKGSDIIKVYTPIKSLERGGNPSKTYNQFNSEFYAVGIEEGDMVFWESLIMHDVPPLEFDGIRRSIAFDLSIGRKVEKSEMEFKNQLQDYVAIYNINDPSLCAQAVEMLKGECWAKHSYNNPITDEYTTYEDDLDIVYADNEVVNRLQAFFGHCARDYIETVSPNSFELQEVTNIRFNRYNSGANMKPHHDHIHTLFDGERKGVPILSILALLNDDFEGGDFLMFDGKKLLLSPGDVVVFPSNFLYPHAVTAVTKGTRYSCVSWGY